jgi:hypothetical protein
MTLGNSIILETKCSLPSRACASLRFPSPRTAVEWMIARLRLVELLHNDERHRSGPSTGRPVMSSRPPET